MGEHFLVIVLDLDPQRSYFSTDSDWGRRWRRESWSLSIVGTKDADIVWLTGRRRQKSHDRSCES